MKLSTSVFSDILSDYEKRRRDNILSAMDLRDRLYEKYPEFRQIDDEFADLSFERVCLRRDSGFDADETAYLKKHDELIARKKDLFKKYGLEEDCMEVKYDCPACKDTGFIGSDRCECLKKRLTEKLYDQSNIRSILERENFGTYTDAYYNDGEKAFMNDLISQIRNFISDFDTTHRNLLFFGDPGSGKTFITNCIAKELLDSGHSVIYFSASQIFDLIAAIKFRDSSDYGNFPLTDIYECDLLVIDDLGTEYVNSFTSQELFNILNKRRLLDRSTIISTNLDMQQLKETYSERSASRIFGYYNLFEFKGRDMRLLMRGAAPI